MCQEKWHVHYHPCKYLMKNQKQSSFLLPQTPLHSATTHNSLDGEVIDLLARVSSEEFSVLPADLLQPEKWRKAAIIYCHLVCFQIGLRHEFAVRGLMANTDSTAAEDLWLVTNKHLQQKKATLLESCWNDDNPANYPKDNEGYDTWPTCWPQLGKLSCEQVLCAARHGSINAMGRLQKTTITVMTFSRQLRNM